MNRAIGGLLVAAGASGLIGACGGDGGGLPAEDFSSELERAFCEWGARCSAVPDVDACLESESAPFDPSGLTTIVSGVEAGLIDYHSDSAAACIAIIDALGCTIADVQSLQRGFEETCAAVFTGTVADGGPCSINEVCVSGECMLAGPCTDACCPGTCEPTVPAPEPVPVGSECTSTSDCVDAAYCQQTAGPFTCQPLVGESGPCDSSEACDVGLLCISDGTTAPKCAFAAPTGGDCAATICGGLSDYCAQPAGVCTPLPRPGEACTGTGDCVGYAQCLGTACVARGLIGDACGATAPGCLGDLECNAGVCAAPTDPAPCILGG